MAQRILTNKKTKGSDQLDKVVEDLLLKKAEKLRRAQQIVDKDWIDSEEEQDGTPIPEVQRPTSAKRPVQVFSSSPGSSISSSQKNPPSVPKPVPRSPLSVSTFAGSSTMMMSCKESANLDEALQIFQEWKKLYPSTKLETFFTVKIELISPVILIACANSIASNDSQASRENIDRDWYLMLSGAEMQANYEKQLKASDFVDQIRSLLSDYDSSNSILKKQNDSVIENTTKLQGSMQRLLTQSEETILKLRSLEPPKTPRVIPAEKESTSKAYLESATAYYGPHKITWTVKENREVEVKLTEAKRFRESIFRSDDLIQIFKEVKPESLVYLDDQQLSGPFETLRLSGNLTLDGLLAVLISC